MYTIDKRVYASQTDENGFLKLVSAIDMMQDCSLMWLESEPKLDAFFKETGATMVLVSRQADFLRMPAYGERLTVTTSVYACKGFYGHRNTFIRDEAGKTCVASWSLGAFINLQTGKMVRLPQDVMDACVIDAPVEMAYLDKKVVLPAGEGEAMPPLTAGHYDVDFNRHVNNARYVQMAAEYLPEGFETARLRIAYRRPAKRGDALLPTVLRAEDGKQYVALNDAAGEPYTLMEFAPSM